MRSPMRSLTLRVLDFDAEILLLVWLYLVGRHLLARRVSHPLNFSCVKIYLKRLAHSLFSEARTPAPLRSSRGKDALRPRFL